MMIMCLRTMSIIEVKMWELENFVGIIIRCQNELLLHHQMMNAVIGVSPRVTSSLMAKISHCFPVPRNKLSFAPFNLSINPGNKRRCQECQILIMS